MQLGIFAKTFEGTSPDEVLIATVGAGYTAAQYNMACSGMPSMPDRISLQDAHAIARAARNAKLTIAAVSGTYNMIHPDGNLREQGHARLEILASRCRAMSASLITLCTGTRDPIDQWRAHPDNDDAEAWSDLAASMERAIGIAEKYDIFLGIEPELANAVSSAEKARKLIDEMGSPRLKVILDPANLFESATREEQRRLVSSAIDMLGDRIVMGHAKDRGAGGSVVAAGNGVVDFHHFIGRLHSAGFDGPIITHGLCSADAPAVSKFLRRVLAETGVRLE
jgi:sugar phosphate isomerase/epimerase